MGDGDDHTLSRSKSQDSAMRSKIRPLALSSFPSGDHRAPPATAREHYRPSMRGDESDLSSESESASGSEEGGEESSGGGDREHNDADQKHGGKGPRRRSLDSSLAALGKRSRWDPAELKAQLLKAGVVVGESECDGEKEGDHLCVPIQDRAGNESEGASGESASEGEEVARESSKVTPRVKGMRRSKVKRTIGLLFASKDADSGIAVTHSSNTATATTTATTTTTTSGGEKEGTEQVRKRKKNRGRTLDEAIIKIFTHPELPLFHSSKRRESSTPTATPLRTSSPSIPHENKSSLDASDSSGFKKPSPRATHGAIPDKPLPPRPMDNNNNNHPNPPLPAIPMDQADLPWPPLPPLPHGIPDELLHPLPELPPEAHELPPILPLPPAPPNLSPTPKRKVTVSDAEAGKPLRQLIRNASQSMLRNECVLLSISSPPPQNGSLFFSSKCFPSSTGWERE